MNAAEYYTPEPRGSQAYGAARPNGRIHTGDDFSHATRPDTVRVPYVRAGRVTMIQRDHPSLPNGYGNQVQVTHPDGSRHTYGHLGRITASVGKQVTSADSPGTEGTSGFVTGSCMHIEYWTPAGARADPYPHIKSALSALAGGGDAPLPIREEEDEDMAQVFTKASDAATVYEIRGGKKRRVTAAEWAVTKAAYAAAGDPVPYAKGTLTKAQLNDIPNA